MSGFLGRRTRLTRGRLVGALGAIGAACAVIAILAPLIGTDQGRGGWHLTFDDWLTDGDLVWRFRVPRVLGCFVVGGALAAAGAALQAVLRNPLAEPFTLGVSSGASLAAVLAIRFGLAGALGGAAVGVSALIGAATTIALVWRLGKVGDSLPPATLLLAGVTISMFCSAASMLVQMTSEFRDIGYMVRWMMGDVGAVTYDQLAMAGPAIGVGLLALIWFARDLNALAAGPEAAASVGVDAGRTETIVFAIASLLVGASIAVAGPIGFVGLMVPHALRAVVGPDHRVLVPASILAGGGFLIVCDTIARIATPGNQIPVGVITALLGGPFFVLILVRAKRSAGLWGMR